MSLAEYGTELDENGHPATPDDATTRAPARVPLRDRLLTLDELGNLAPPEPLIDGFLYRNTLAQLSATAGSYKTFAAIAMSCSVALGEAWEGHRVPSAEKVIYVAAEGASGLRSRILAWCELSGYDPDRLSDQLYVLPCPIQLGNFADVSEACDMAREIGAGLVVLDTRAKCTIGLEENSATEQGRAIAAAERIQEAAGCTVLDIHHAGRSGSTPRGSTAWDGGVWSDLRMEGSDLVAKISCEKHKDAPSGCEHHFRAVPHTVSETLMPGVPETARQTLVVVSSDGETDPLSLTGSVRQLWDAVETASTSAGMSPATLLDVSDISRATFYRALKTLQTRGFIKNAGTEKRPMWVGTALGRQAFKGGAVS
ncbi:helicase RepA family protein [Gordonia sp. GONU]|uniref:AAA family ATPase n=1 Tax=Gordonia sp. GONU TaxID=2972949 RepID=UPI0021ABDA57|nr:helicase RepA family protein [Gordonia sp. GONU]MCR8896512.1 helicase RepA family protein [Gordonia sp. GONU]